MRGVVTKVLHMIISLFFCGLLVSCMHAVPKDRIAAMKRVGIVSLLGDTIELGEEKILPMPGSIASAPFHVRSWGIDLYIRALIEDQLTRQKSINVVHFEYDHEALWKANYDGPEIRDAQMRPILASHLLKISRRNNLDSLIIAYSPPRRAGPEPNQLLPFCLYRSYGLTGKRVTYHVFVWIRVLDGRSMETLGLQAFYHKESLEASFWPPFTDINQLTMLEKRTKSILGQRVPIKVKELGFEGGNTQGMHGADDNTTSNQ